MTMTTKKLLRTAATLIALAAPAVADELPVIYLGTWCVSNSDDETGLTPDPASKHPIAKVGAEACPNADRIRFMKKGYDFGKDTETCRFTSVRKTGQSWPRWTKPLKGDWVPEVDITARCEEGPAVKFRLIWNKGDQLTMESRP